MIPQKVIFKEEKDHDINSALDQKQLSSNGGWSAWRGRIAEIDNIRIKQLPNGEPRNATDEA